MTTKTLNIETTGYLRIVEMIREADSDVVSLHFEHTKTGDKACATISIMDITPQWPLDMFRKFNADYPDHLDHMEEVDKWIRRFI